MEKGAFLGFTRSHGERNRCVHTFALFEGLAFDIELIANLRQETAIVIIADQPHGFNGKRHLKASKSRSHIVAGATPVIELTENIGHGFFRWPRINLNVAVNTPGTGAKNAAAAQHYFKAGSVISLSCAKATSGESLFLPR